MEKEPYQPSAEEMAKAQEMADAVQNERGEEMMTWEERSRSGSRPEYIERRLTEEMPKGQEMANAVQNERGEEMMTSEQKANQVMTWKQENASRWRANLFKEENNLKEKGLGELSNIKFKEVVVTNSEGYPIVGLYEGSVNGHNIVVKAVFGDKRNPNNEVSIDGLPLPKKDQDLFLEKIEDYLMVLESEHIVTKRAIEENRQIVEKSRQNEEEARRGKERIGNEQKASEILKSILGEEKRENN